MPPLLPQAVALHRAGKVKDAEPLYRSVLASDPKNMEACYNLGIMMLHLQRYQEAVACYDQFIALDPNVPAVYNNRAYVLNALGRYREALASAEKAVALKPDFAPAWNTRGVVLYALGRDADALASYEKAVALDPALVEAIGNSGHLLRKARRFEEALARYDQAAALHYDTPYFPGDRLHTQMHLCHWQNVDADLAAITKGIEAGKPVAPPFVLAGLSSSPDLQRKCAGIFVKTMAAPKTKLWNGEKYAHDKIRIAYISADFREHPTSYLLAGLLEQHDRTRFELYGLSLTPPDASAIGQRVKAACDHFIDVSPESDFNAAKKLRAVEVDIAVDLMGFTLASRPGIFAHRPAPVQVNYLGFPATMGAPYIDYIIADAFVIPPQSRGYYSEKIAFLPDCFQANDDKRFRSGGRPPRAACGLPENGFVFCSFNHSYKITPAFFDVWMRLLQSVPGSVLWLLGGDTVQRNLRAEAKLRGIAPERLIFAKRVPYEEHLVRLAAADLFLDTSPFNAGATASDALWAGLPLLTCAGEAFNSRMAGSLLTAMGLPELITTNLNDYEAWALELANKPQTLSAIREKLADHRTAPPLFNTKRFAGNIECAYTGMWEKCRAGTPPDDIYVKS